MTLILNKSERNILNALQYGEEPFEVIDAAVEKTNPKSTPYDTINELFALYKMGFVIIKQQPITALRQDFTKKTMSPKSPMDILGDLREYFNEYCKTRKYLWELTLGGGPSGLPFGIWVEITASGEEEAKKPEYMEYSSTDEAGECNQKDSA